MSLYLAALGIPDRKAYLGLFAKNQPRRVAIIPTAWNVAPTAKSDPFMQGIEKTFAELGFTTLRVDLADYHNKQTELQRDLADISAIWVMGGNTFYLNYWMRESGFDKLLPDLLAKGIVYGGESAGAVVAGKTLHGIELLDDPAEAPETLWPGLNLVDYGIIPHWGEQKYADRLEQSRDEMRLFCPVKTLKNTDVIIVK
ncbi:MAG TPA: Type 1 glutamine amidotransferase-like domain-containing protein [Magnetospirillaceae bacterium]|nr:Type 1 glutamine amidotransferase-like domain-containing protein [Magnetospirillaceae bacterium]